MSAATPAPIITIAWQQPTKWIGVEEHVRRGRIRNKGELTAGMVVQVMYKKGWYKAKVVNSDPLRTRNRTKKSCTCCASPTKHTHATKGKDRRRSSRANQPSSESDTTTQASKDDVNAGIDSKTDSGAKQSEAGDVNLKQRQLTDSGNEGSIIKNNDHVQEENVSDSQRSENNSVNDGAQGATASVEEENHIQSGVNPGDEGRSVSNKPESVSDSMNIQSGTGVVQDEVKGDGQEMIENPTKSANADKNGADHTTKEMDQTVEQVNQRVEPDQITDEPDQITDEQDQTKDKPDQVTDAPDQITTEPAQITNEPDQITAEPAQITAEPAQITNEPDQITDEPDQITERPEQTTEKTDQIAEKQDQIKGATDQITDEPDKVTDEVDQVSDEPEQIVEKQDQSASDADQNAVEQVANDQTADEQVTKDQTSIILTVSTASEQIAKEHMYSQPMPAQKKVTITKELEVKIHKLQVPLFQTDINSDKDQMITDNVHPLKSHSEPELGSSATETPQQTETKMADSSDAASVESETTSAAETNASSDVNVVYIRPSDIQMPVNESQTNKDELTTKEHTKEGEKEVAEMECEPSVENRNDSQISVENSKAADAESFMDQADQPVQLEMAHPDEPLGQIKISEPISLAGNEEDRQAPNKPCESIPGSQVQKQLESNSSVQEMPSASAVHRQPGTKLHGLTKQAEIKHRDRSKGLVAHQTTLPSGHLGPIILTMKAKKPKHKKSKKKNKHKDKDKEKDRSKEMVSSPPPEAGFTARPPPSAVEHQQKLAEPPQRVTVGHPQVAVNQLQVAGRPPQAAAMQSQAAARQSQAAARQSQAAARQSQAAARQPQLAARQPQLAARQPQLAARQPQAAARHPQAVSRQVPSGVQSPPNRSVQNPVMRSPNVIVSADGSMRHSVEPIRHIEPPRAHLPPPQRGQAPGGRAHSQSSQPSPTSPPSPHHQWYPVNMQHHPRMAGPPPGHPAHMSPAEFAAMRARHQQQYHSGLPPYVEASFAGAPQHIRGGNPHPMSNAPSPAEAAYIRAQSLARHCHHPHWQPNGPPPQFIRDPHMAGSPLLRVPRYAHPPYVRMPGDIPPGAGRPPPLIPAPGQHPRSIHPVSIHKTRPEGARSQHTAEMGASSPTATITPSSSTSESVQSISPQGAQKRGREPSAGELENMIAQQFQENGEGERVIGVAELIELRNALRRHHGFADEPPAKSPRLDGTVTGSQPETPCPPMLASVGLQPRPPNAQQIDRAISGQAVMGPAGMMGNALSLRAQHPHVSVATSNVSNSQEQQHVASVQPQPKPTEGPHTGDTPNTSGHQPGGSTPQNPARHWVAEAQQLYPRQGATAQQSASNPVDITMQRTSTPDRSTAAVPVAPSSRPVPPLAPIPKPQNAGRPVQRSGRKQKTPHRRPTMEDIVIVKSEPLSPGYEAEDSSNLCQNSPLAESDEQSRLSQMLNQQGSDSMDSVTETDVTSAEQRSSGSSGPISQLQTLCTRLSSSRTPIIPPQSIQSAPPMPAHLTQMIHHPVVHPPVESVQSSPAHQEVRSIPPLMQDIPSHQMEIFRDQRSHNPAPPSQESVPPPATSQPRSPVELEPTSSGLNESAPSPDTSSAAKVDKDADVARRLSFLEREMGIVKSWVWEIRTMLTSRSSGLRKGLPKCTDIGDGNVLVGSGEHTIIMARVDYLDCWDKTENAKDLVVKLISKVFTEEELAMSNFNGGMIRSTYKKRLADDPRFNAILAQAEKEYGVGNLEDRKAIREAVNNKCRKKAFKFRQQEAITQRINQQYQMYKE